MWIRMVRVVPAVAVFGMLAAGAAAAQDGDAAKGEKVFRKCAVCHTVDPEKPSGAGPNLHGVVGRTTGTLEGFKYSDTMVEAGEAGHVWTPEELDKYLENPKEALPGNKMLFAGLKKPEDRADVIAYLETQSGS